MSVAIRFITTGGTIDKVYFDAASEFEVGESQIPDLLSRSQVTFDYEVETVCKKDSLDLTDADRALIRERVVAAPERHVVITHGTDTMVTTARSLSGVADKVIVLTGSLSPARFRRSDAEFNVGMAIGVVQSMPPGVYIAMSGQVFDPARVRKNREQNRFEETDTDD